VFTAEWISLNLQSCSRNESDLRHSVPGQFPVEHWVLHYIPKLFVGCGTKAGEFLSILKCQIIKSGYTQLFPASATTILRVLRAFSSSGCRVVLTR
jgi:hypothetical protein